MKWNPFGDLLFSPEKMRKVERMTAKQVTWYFEVKRGLVEELSDAWQPGPRVYVWYQYNSANRTVTHDDEIRQFVRILNEEGWIAYGYKYDRLEGYEVYVSTCRDAIARKVDPRLVPLGVGDV